MNNIEELIQQLCPAGVEFKELEEVVNLTMGTSPAGNTFSSNSTDGIEFHQGKTSFGNEIIKHSNVYTTSPIKVAEPDSLIMSVRAPVGDTNLTNRKIAIGRGLCSMDGKDNLTTKFLYYFINENIKTFKNKSNGSTFEAINTQEIKKVQIPIPPLPIQQEIVSILDKFTQLEAELEAELEARKKQYEYYRNQLLMVNDEGLMFDGVQAEWKTLDLISKNLDAKRKPVRSSDRISGKYPYYGASGIVDYVSEYIFNGDYLLISEDGANLLARNTPIAFSISGKTWVNNHSHVLQFDNYATRRFVELYLNSIDLSKFISGAAQPKLNKENLYKIQIPIPPLAEQERIVEILDKFDKLVNDISVGLPAEIAARRKQYEYYRGKLLSFKVKDN